MRGGARVRLRCTVQQILVLIRLPRVKKKDTPRFLGVSFCITQQQPTDSS